MQTIDFVYMCYFIKMKLNLIRVVLPGEALQVNLTVLFIYLFN